jgi:glyoxylase-like metal-dependent hydrolase (beta-lactamase superfamily II)
MATATAPGTTLFGEAASFEGGLHEVAPRTFAWLQPNGDLGESNAGLVVGDGESTLVDTLWDVRLTRRMLETMEPHTSSAPATHLVNTHSDGDHWWGNQLLPAAERITSAASAAVMEHELATGAPAQFERLKKLAATLRQQSERRLPGPVRRRMRDFGSYVGQKFAPYEFGEVQLTGPTRTFEDSLSLTVGGRALELIVVGPAHTPGDLIVWVPDVRAVFAADIGFIGVTPVMWAGPRRNWLSAIDTIAALDPEVVVPGHGPVCGVAELEAVAAYWRWLEAAARPHFANGASPYAAAEKIATGRDFRGQPWADWVAPERIVINCHLLHREASGQRKPLTPLQRILVFAQVGRLAARLRGS